MNYEIIKDFIFNDKDNPTKKIRELYNSKSHFINPIVIDHFLNNNLFTSKEKKEVIFIICKKTDYSFDYSNEDVNKPTSKKSLTNEKIDKLLENILDQHKNNVKVLASQLKYFYSEKEKHKSIDEFISKIKKMTKKDIEGFCLSHKQLVVFKSCISWIGGTNINCDLIWKSKKMVGEKHNIKNSEERNRVVRRTSQTIAINVLSEILNTLDFEDTLITWEMSDEYDYVLNQIEECKKFKQKLKVIQTQSPDKLKGEKYAIRLILSQYEDNFEKVLKEQIKRNKLIDEKEYNGYNDGILDEIIDQTLKILKNLKNIDLSPEEGVILKSKNKSKTNNIKIR